MKPIISIIGRSGVGKSRLFLSLTQEKKSRAINQMIPTRDRIYGFTKINDVESIIIDTGGFSDDKNDQFNSLIQSQIENALIESNIILFVVDASVEVTYLDMKILKLLRSYNKQIILVINKADKDDHDVLFRFQALGLEHSFIISDFSKHELINFYLFINPFLMKVYEQLITKDDEPLEGIKFAILGRPNVGKSTLINSLIGEDRAIISEIPGTTLESVMIPHKHLGKDFILIDTAGIRRKSKIKNVIERKTIYQSIRSIDIADIVLFVVSAEDGLVDQDLKLINTIINIGTPVIIAVNKWDILKLDDRDYFMRKLEHQLRHARFISIHTISALKNIKIKAMMNHVQQTYSRSIKPISTSILTKYLLEAIEGHKPPLYNGAKIKLKYAHLGGHNPHLIIIHGTRTRHMPKTYISYLKNFFREKLKLTGVQIKIIFKEKRQEREK